MAYKTMVMYKTVITLVQRHLLMRKNIWNGIPPPPTIFSSDPLLAERNLASLIKQEIAKQCLSVASDDDGFVWRILVQP